MKKICLISLLLVTTQTVVSQDKLQAPAKEIECSEGNNLHGTFKEYRSYNDGSETNSTFYLDENTYSGETTNYRTGATTPLDDATAAETYRQLEAGYKKQEAEKKKK